MDRSTCGSRPCLRGAFVGLAVVLLALGRPCAGADWKPDRNVEIVVPTGPGGGNDRAGRMVQKLLGDLQLLDVTVSIANKPGAGGVIGWTYLDQQAGNGDYIATSTPTLLTARIAGRSGLTYTDVTPIAQLYSEATVFLVNAASPLKTAQDLVAKLRSDPGSVTVTIGTSTGNNNHVALAALARAAGVDPRRVKAVVFRSSSEATTAVLGGHVDLAVLAGSGHVKAVEAGRLRALAVASARRSAGAYADVPTWKELGYDVVASYWLGVIGPRGLAAPQVDFWNRTFAAVTGSGEWKRYLATYGLENDYMDSEASRRFLATQYEAYETALSALGLAKTGNAK